MFKNQHTRHPRRSSANPSVFHLCSIRGFLATQTANSGKRISMDMDLAVWLQS